MHIEFWKEKIKGRLRNICVDGRQY